MKKQKHNVRVSADYLQTSEAYKAKQNRFASDALKEETYENDSAPEERKTSLLQDRSSKLLNSSMRKKGSLVSINSSKLMNIHNDSG